MILLAVLPAGALAAAVYDLTSFRIPNWLTLSLGLSFVPVAWLAGLPWPEIGTSMAVGAAVLLVTFVMFQLGWFGGGDAKLAAAMACWTGLAQLVPFLLATSIFGGALALVLIVFRRIPLRERMAEHGVLLRLHDPSQGVPYGIALGFAALLVFPDTQVWKALVEFG